MMFTNPFFNNDQTRTEYKLQKKSRYMVLNFHRKTLCFSVKYKKLLMAYKIYNIETEIYEYIFLGSFPQ